MIFHYSINQNHANQYIIPLFIIEKLLHINISSKDRLEKKRVV